jgi:hypothetical protein
VSAQQRASQTRKATVVAVNYNKTTGVVTADLNLSGDTSVVVPAVNVVQGVSPNVGDTVNVLKQDATMSVVSQIGSQTTGGVPAGGWIQATLGSGFSHNGDSQGNLYYRLVNDQGAQKMEWMGAVGVSGSVTSVLSSALASTYCPSAKRKILVARGYAGGDLGIQIIFNTNGTVVLDGGGRGVPAHTHYLGITDTQLSGYESLAGSDLGHAHGMGNNVDTEGNFSTPDWVSFHGVYYYL